MSRSAATTGNGAWLPFALGGLAWILTYVVGAIAYGLLLVTFVDPLADTSSSTRDAVFAVLVGLVIVAATFVASVVVRRQRPGPVWWLLALPVLVAGWGVVSPPPEDPMWPAWVAAAIGIAGSASVVWSIGSGAAEAATQRYPAR